jgi:hypothetical protein
VREVQSDNADGALKRTRHALIARRVALALLIAPLIGFYVFWRSGLDDSMKPALWVGLALPAVAALVWAAIKFDYTDMKAEDVLTSRTHDAHKAAIIGPLSATGREAEILLDDQPKDLEVAHYVVPEAVAIRGAGTGWTLFKCWGIIDQPGGSRREEKTTAWIREADTLHQDIGEWLAADEGAA